MKNTISLLQAVERHKVPRFIFSSSAAVYGIPDILPVPETAANNPINPYGRSKLMAEWVLQDFAASTVWFRFGALRYFNVAGCDPKGRLGQNNLESTHLIKLACQAALNQRPELQVFGDDYSTPDGTGIRDFIHVSDLAQAHLALLSALENGCPSQTLNCGYGHGYSVYDVVKTVKEISGVDFPVTIAARRAGDPPVVVADVRQILSQTKWRPAYSDLNLIIQTALDWEKKLAQQ
jgi:UDP-glucose 4-epimerase